MIEVSHGAGRVRLVGFALGRTYLDYEDGCTVSGLPSELGAFPRYVGAVREAVQRLVGEVPRPAWTSDPMLEVVRLERPDGGAALVLLSYANAHLDALTVTAPGLEGTARALFGGGEVSFDADGTAILPLSDVEVLDFPAPPDDDPEPYDVPPEAGGCGCADTTPVPWALLALGAAVIRRRWAQRR